MIKFLIILVLIVYSLFRVGTFILRMFFGGLGKHQYSQQRTSSRKAPGSNLNIDNIRNSNSKTDKKFTGGEYVDYEEVK